MRLRNSFWIAALALTACGPGAGQRPIIQQSETVYDFTRATYITPPELLAGALQGEFSCEGPCAKTTPAVKPPAGLKDLRTTSAEKGDADVGAVVWRGRIPEGVSTIAVPMVTGPETSRTRIIVKCGVVTRTVAARDTWSYRRLTLKQPSGSCDLEIRAIDDGPSWGQWIAIGTPEMLR